MIWMGEKPKKENVAFPFISIYTNGRHEALRFLWGEEEAFMP